MHVAAKVQSENKEAVQPLPNRQARRAMQRRDKKAFRDKPIQVNVQQALAGIQKNPSLVLITDALQALSRQVQRHEIALLTLIRTFQQKGTLAADELGALERLIQFGPESLNQSPASESAEIQKEDEGDGTSE